jgi:GNAT superfamily N-acetyltransferase
MRSELETAHDLNKSMGLSALSIREINVADAEAAAQLSGELGYPVSAGIMRERICRLEFLPNHVVFVACLDHAVVGWIDVDVVHHLQAEPSAEIGGLVVSRDYRSVGIGRMLLMQAEGWARKRHLKRMIVRSRITRDDAHRFYLREGYEKIKTSAVFSKMLTGS